MRLHQKFVCILILGGLTACGQPGTANVAINTPTRPAAASTPQIGNTATLADDQETDQAETEADQANQQAPTSGIDPCTLFTKADAEAALGEPVDAAVPLATASLQGCQYLATNTALRAASVQFITSAILQEAGSPYSTVRAFYASMKQAGTTEPVTGIGDEADWLTVQGIARPQLWVIHGDTLLTVSIGAPTEENTRPATEALAKLVVSRLP